MKKFVFNGRKVETQADVLDWPAIQNLAGVMEPTVTWKAGDKSGSPRFGQSIALIDGMVIDAIQTGAA